MKIIGNIGNIGHKLGLERQILIDGLRGCCFRQLMVGRLNVKAYHLFGIAIDTVDILLPVLLLAGDAGGIVGQAGEAAIGLQGIREGALGHRTLGVAHEVAVDLGVGQCAVEMP